MTLTGKGMVQAMTPIRARDVIWWHLTGVLLGACASMLCVLVTGYHPPHDSFQRTTLAMGGTVAMWLLGATPITLPALLLWTRLSRAFPAMEANVALRWVGLAAIGGLSFLVASFFFLGLVSNTWTVGAFWYAYTLNEESTWLFLCLSMGWAILPRLVLPTFRNAVYLRASG